MDVTMERVLRWRLIPRAIMCVLVYIYVDTIWWFQSLPPEAMTTQATALTATVSGCMTGMLGLWLGSSETK